MTTTWKVLIDWDRNGDFTGTYDDVTTYVLHAKWYLGFSQAYAEVANDSTLELVLDNSDKRFSPENNDSVLNGKLLPLRTVRITSDDGTTERIHWQGWLQNILPVAGKYGERSIQMTAAGAMQFLKAAESKIELQENKRTDEVIDTLIREVVFPPSVTKGAFVGIPGFSEISQNAYVVDLDDIRVLDEGAVTLELAADNWVSKGGFADRPKDTFDVYRGIKDMIATERGKFFFDRTGRAIFWNRHKLLADYTSSATFNDTMQELKYSYGSMELLKNELRVTCHPRTISDNDQDILWQLEGSVIRVDPNDTRELYIKFEDDSENRIGGQDVTVGDLEFEKGSASATVEAKANGANLIFTNNTSEEAIISACIVRGRRITDKGYMEASAEDTDSIVTYGRRTMRVNLPSMDDLEQAQYIADFELLRRKDPIGQVQAISCISHAKSGGGQHAHQLARTIGDFITITETQTGHSQDHVIVGEAHELGEAATYLKTTWYLEPATDRSWLHVGDEIGAYGVEDTPRYISY